MSKDDRQRLIDIIKKLDSDEEPEPDREDFLFLCRLVLGLDARMNSAVEHLVIYTGYREPKCE